MTVIEVDGVETEPVVVDQLTIYAAQRYSIVVDADQAVDNYCKRKIISLASGPGLTTWTLRDPRDPFCGHDWLYGRHQLGHLALCRSR